MSISCDNHANQRCFSVTFLKTSSRCEPFIRGLDPFEPRPSLWPRPSVARTGHDSSPPPGFEDDLRMIYGGIIVDLYGFIGDLW